MPREIVILGKKHDDEKSDSEGTGTTPHLVPAAPKELEPVQRAADKLRVGIAERFNSPDYVTLAMHVNLNTAKADLIPVPHPENMRKMKYNFSRLPMKVQDVVRKNIPEEQMKAVEEIYEYLETKPVDAERIAVQEAKALEEKERED
ncbi:hypothetical protein [Nitrososphaera sp.]|uniref:hypothetical protein n=1 Tax=Nitrososphaera sp. TaxID=1971748 RepID=UPI00307EDBB0